MQDDKNPETGAAAPVGEELRQLAQSFAALGRTAFQGGRALSVELLRSVRGVVDRAREEIERMTGEKK